MTPGSIMLAAALLLLVGVYVFRPMLVPYRSSRSRASARDQLQIEKDALLSQIKALDFDHDTGKIPDEVYAVQRPELMQQAADILRRLDNLPISADRDPIEAQIEAAVARLRKKAGGKRRAAPVASAAAPAVASADSIAADDAEDELNFCPKCGTPVVAGDQFCRKCGKKL